MKTILYVYLTLICLLSLTSIFLGSIKNDLLVFNSHTTNRSQISTKEDMKVSFFQEDKNKFVKYLSSNIVSNKFIQCKKILPQYKETFPLYEDDTVDMKHLSILKPRLEKFYKTIMKIALDSRNANGSAIKTKEIFYEAVDLSLNLELKEYGYFLKSFNFLKRFETCLFSSDPTKDLSNPNDYIQLSDECCRKVMFESIPKHCKMFFNAPEINNNTFFERFKLKETSESFKNATFYEQRFMNLLGSIESNKTTDSKIKNILNSFALNPPNDLLFARTHKKDFLRSAFRKILRKVNNFIEEIKLDSPSMWPLGRKLDSSYHSNPLDILVYMGLWKRNMLEIDYKQIREYINEFENIRSFFAEIQCIDVNSRQTSWIYTHLKTIQSLFSSESLDISNLMYETYINLLNLKILYLDNFVFLRYKFTQKDVIKFIFSDFLLNLENQTHIEPISFSLCLIYSDENNPNPFLFESLNRGKQFNRLNKTDFGDIYQNNASDLKIKDYRALYEKLYLTNITHRESTKIKKEIREAEKFFQMIEVSCNVERNHIVDALSDICRVDSKSDD